MFIRWGSAGDMDHTRKTWEGVKYTKGFGGGSIGLKALDNIEEAVNVVCFNPGLEPFAKGLH